MHVFGEVLGHFLRQGGDEGAEALFGGFAGLLDDVVDLAGGLGLHRADLHGRVDQAGGADDLFGEHAAGLVQLPRARRGGDVQGLRAHGLPFLEFEGAVIQAGGQAEAVLGQGALAAEVAFDTWRRAGAR
jgi:hypothetical protein